MSQKMRWALERLHYGEGTAATEWRERNLKHKERLDGLEEGLRIGLQDIGTALDEFKEETARQFRRVDGQLAVLELDREGTESRAIRDGESEGQPKRSGPPWWRTGDPARRNVMGLLFEWRRALAELIATEQRLNMTLERDVALVAHSACRDEASAERRTPRRRQLSMRKLARSENTGDDLPNAD